MLPNIVYKDIEFECTWCGEYVHVAEEDKNGPCGGPAHICVECLREQVRRMDAILAASEDTRS